VATLSLRMQHQKHSDWCWAAVASSISEHFSRTSPWCQCKLAREMTKRKKHCCGHPFTKNLAEECNQPWYLDRALKIVKRLDGKAKEGRLSYSQIKKQINEGRPVCVRIQWGREGAGHFVVISGCQKSSRGDRWLYVEDPFYGNSTWEFREFCTNYQYADGHWTHTFPVKNEVKRAAS
jgi:hypothetical protein